MELLSQHIESLIFTAEKPIKLKEIKSILEETFEAKFKNADLETAIEEIQNKYEADQFAFEMVGIAEGYQFLTKGAYYNTVATFLKQTTRKRLSRAALETLSIIAYKQPVSRPEMERIRGVSCDYAIHKLLEKEMVTILGRSEAVGRPLLYGTSVKFLDYFGLKDMNDMPKPKDFRTVDNTIGEAAPIEEDTPNSNIQKVSAPSPLTTLDEIVDIVAGILPDMRKAKVNKSESVEEAKPITALDEVVDTIAAALPYLPRPKREEPAVSDIDEQPVPAEVEEEGASKLKPIVDATPSPASAIIKTETVTRLDEVVDTVAATLPLEPQMKEDAPAVSDENEPPTSAEENRGGASNELDEVVDVITASVPIENIPSESVVLNDVVVDEIVSWEEE